MILVLLANLLCVKPFSDGLSYLEKVPPAFECEQYSSKGMTDIIQNHQKSWKACTVKEICAEKMPKHKYRPVKSNPEYLNNWVQKLDLLCVSEAEIGLLGSSFFFGLLVSTSWAPSYADTHGRLFLIQMTILVRLVA